MRYAIDVQRDGEWVRMGHTIHGNTPEAALAFAQRMYKGEPVRVSLYTREPTP